MTFPKTRLRRLRYNKAVRDLVEDTNLRPRDLIYPVFVSDNLKSKKEIISMPGQYQIPLNLLNDICDKILSNGIKSIFLFGVPTKKDEHGLVAQSDDGIVQKAIKIIKKNYPDILIIADLCNCQYTNHGHCGTIVDNDVDNDLTLKNLGLQALSLVRSGADIIAPSDMMDGRVGYLRNILDKNNFIKTPIFSYCIKYSSSFYGPFREAAENTPEFGDRRSYQMNFKNSFEALREAETDINEGADVLIIKPALSYLDIIYKVKSKFSIPVIAFNVSGEYSMVKSASDRNWIDGANAAIEILTSMKRAGASAIVTYHALEIAKKLNKN
tara:strand:+ start:928 stop:1905 length:978 start_codon:yes stop_codon:yes gene_type:complete